jgi:hypothetical protein
MSIAPIGLRYRSGEKITKGDRVLYHGNAATIKFIADGLDPENEWYVQEFGGGLMILDPLCSGFTFISAEQLQEYEDLEFVSTAIGGAGSDPTG